MVILGTQVREQIDEIAKTTLDRSLWVSRLDWVFICHRTFVYIILAVNGYLIYKSVMNNWYKNRWIQIGIVILAEALTGVLLAHFGFPKLAQPLHLFLSTILFALQFDLIIKLQAPRAMAFGAKSL